MLDGKAVLKHEWLVWKSAYKLLLIRHILLISGLSVVTRIW